MQLTNITHQKCLTRLLVAAFLERTCCNQTKLRSSE